MSAPYRRSIAVALALVATAACSPDAAPPTTSPSTSGAAPPAPTSFGVAVVRTIDLPAARAAMESGQAEIRRVLGSELGTAGWTEDRPAQENASPSCGGVADVGKFYAPEFSHPRPIEPSRWAPVWAEIVRAVEPHGFRPATGAGTDPPAGPARPDSHFEYLVNPHGDQLTVSSIPGIGTGYGGFSVCHPWES